MNILIIVRSAMKLLIVFFVVLKLRLISCDSSCNTIKKCGECIGNPYDQCVWCAQEDLKGEYHRCESRSNLYSSSVPWCKKEFTVDPMKSVNTTRDADDDWKVGSDTVQFRPLEKIIKVRPGEPITFRVSYKPAKHYPLDVYFLIDNSYTMKDHKKELKEQAYAIYNQLITYTNNVQFGVGTFIEKPAFPYFDKSFQDNAYSFEHNLAFTSNITLFSDIMDNTAPGANYDDPEAGLDGLMQVMVCDNLQWRNNSRRFIVVFTDSTYHSAGDGKMIGITKPNDMKCHLKDNKYTWSLEQDYPSVSQIKKVAYDGSFKIIFAATDNVRSAYEALARSIGSARYTELQSDVVNLIVDQYKNAVATVELEADYPPYIEVKIDQDCKATPKVNCGSTRDKPRVDINVTLTVKSCQNNVNHEVVIGPSALSDKLKIKVEINCECECEKVVSLETSSLCNDGGVLQCGICKCNKDRYGSNCKCTGNSTVTQDIEKCKQNVDDTKYCKGNGECQCGTCICFDDKINGKYYGDFCQFNNKYCPGSSGLICSGNGKCQYNECHCNDGFINTEDRKDCSCAVRDDLCRAPYSEEVCSGYGQCDCGKCVCDKISPDKNDTYLGIYCDSSDEYVEKRCKELGDYAYCNYLHNQKICDSKTNITYNAEVIVVNKTDFNMPFASGNIPTSCKKTLEDGSFILFKYYYEPNEDYKLKMRIQKELEIPPKANIYIAVGSAIGAVVLIGLATLIGWKILVDLHDKREFQKFADEATAAGYKVVNPLYEAPTNSFTNPTFNSTERI